MIIPITPGMSAPGAPQAQMPSETNLLMALAEMHKQGRVGKQPDMTNVVKMPERPARA